MSLLRQPGAYAVTCDFSESEPCLTWVQVALGIPMTLDHLHDEITHQGWRAITSLDATSGVPVVRYFCPRHHPGSRTGFAEVIPAAEPRPARLKVRPIFAWFDLWVGLFVDRPRRRLYIFPIPCFGIVIEWSPRG